MLLALLILLLAAAATLYGVRMAHPLPESHGSMDVAERPKKSARLAVLYGKRTGKERLKTGIYPLGDGREALSIRLELARLADQTIDIQYYIWNNDLTGLFLLQALVAAADRGVKVRIIIDDNTTATTEAMWAAAIQHPNIAVKLFNPFRMRRFRLVNFAMDFMRLNRRMHNKSFIVDGRACVVGGRNIGDNYFAAQSGVHFTDMDVLAVGEVVPHVSAAFQDYWACESVYDAGDFLHRHKGANLDLLREGMSQRELSPEGQALVAALARFSSTTQIVEGKLPLDWASASLVVDDPRKGMGALPYHQLIIGRLRLILEQSEKELQIASAYFVPGKRGTEFLQRLARQGIAVQVLTNSLSSNNLISVHAGYARYRKKLLRAKVELYELKSIGGPDPVSSTRRSKIQKFFGASSSTLHAKVFIVDRKKVFISSFNFDPRSTYLNCEMGILIESPMLARKQLRLIEGRLEQNSYRVVLLEGHRLVWLDMHKRPAEVLAREPDTKLGRRLLVWMISKLPLEWLL